MKRSADFEKWRKFLISRGIRGDLADAWARLARPGIQLVPQGSTRTDTTLVGASKLGGTPDLPKGMDWPLRPAYGYTKEVRDWRDKSVWSPGALQFLAQINLSDVAAAGCDLPLPDQGTLLFFYDAVTQPWGFDPLDRAGWRIIFIETGQQLVRTRDPREAMPVSPLTFQPREGLPDWEQTQDILCGRHGFPLDLVRAAQDLISDDEYDEVCTPEGHCFGGWPALIQRPMDLECQLASNGIYVGSPEGYTNPRAPELAADVHPWRLLLQLDCDEALGWAWGDCGRVYFWCREEDIAERRFYRTWTISQCH